MTKSGIITAIVLAPWVGVLAQVLLGQSQGRIAAVAALFSSLTASILSLVAVVLLALKGPGASLGQNVEWISSYAVHYHVEISGLNVVSVLLIAFVFPLLIAAEWDQKRGRPGHHALLLILQSSVTVMAVAQDLFLVAFASALVLLPQYFLVTIWGGPGRERAGYRAFVFGVIGQTLLTALVVLVGHVTQLQTFSIPELSGGLLDNQRVGLFGRDLSVGNVSMVLMTAFLLFRLPIWPLQGWFSELLEEAPLTTGVFVSGVLTAVTGWMVFGMAYRLFPELIVKFAPFWVLVGLLGMVFGAIGAAGRGGIRSLFANLGLAHTGLILVGVGSMNSAGMVGSALHALASGISLAAFGLLARCLEQRRSQGPLGAEGLPAVSAIALPAFGTLAAAVLLMVAGAPGLATFSSEMLLLMGSFELGSWVTLVVIGSILGIMTVLFGFFRNIFLAEKSEVLDLALREKAVLVPLVLVAVFLGVYPKLLLEVVRPALLTLLSTLP